jgi:hypothetical protein
MQLELRDLKARIHRLDQLARGLAREIGLLFRERRQYLRAVQEALAGADAARVVLAGVVRQNVLRPRPPRRSPGGRRLRYLAWIWVSRPRLDGRAPLG